MLAPLLVAFSLMLPSASPPPAPTPSPSTPAPRIQLDSYQLVILQRPAHPTPYTDAKLEEIQAAHLAHLRELAEAGKLLVAGPLDDQTDPRLRGVEIFRVGSLAEARRLAEEDPAVKAGRLEPVVMTWYVEKGALAFPVAERLRKN
jgi:uncharacterized protein YciI